MHADITAVIVTYHPEASELDQLLQRVTGQVNHIIIVDNATTDADLVIEIRRIAAKIKKAILLVNEVNVGLGAALNQGLEIARNNKSDFVILFDQDSSPHEQMIETLLENLVALSRSNQVGGVGPRFVDSRNGAPTPFERIRFPTNRKIFSKPGEQVRCDYLITSGCLIPLSVLNDVGEMDEGLFIDNVDMDWSFRAAAKGYRLFGIHDASMAHKIGDHLHPMPMGLGDILVHSPQRLYYSSRNRVLLYRRRYVAWKWVLQDLPRFLLKFLRLVIFVAPRRANARAMILGLRDGLAGKGGSCPYKF